MSFYIIETDEENPRHHGMHKNTSPFVITANPNPGDNITYTLPFEIDKTFDENGQIVNGTAEISCFSYTKEDRFQEVRIKVLSHLGRDVFLGEDGAEDAFGHDILVDLFLEVLKGCDWGYAPVDIEIVPKPERGSDKLSKQYDEYILWRRCRHHFSYTPENGWKLESPDHEAILRKSREDRVRDFLRDEFRKQCKALSDEEFEALKQKVLTECEATDQEWINREVGREWASNPVACTLHKLTRSARLHTFDSPQAIKFAAQQIAQRLSMLNNP